MADRTSARFVEETVLDNRQAREVRLQMRITDDSAGVSSAWVRLTTVRGGSAYLTSQRLVSGTANDGVWEFSGTLPTEAATGRGRSPKVYAVDEAGRRTTLGGPTVLPSLTVH